MLPINLSSIPDIPLLVYRESNSGFATTVTLMNGVPIERVSKILGHTNIRTTQLYAKILDEKVGSYMASLREIFATGVATHKDASVLNTSIEIVQATDKKRVQMRLC